jgi:hypothetical protein
MVQRAAAQSNTERFMITVGVAKGPPYNQAGWSDNVYFSRSLILSFAHLEFPSNFLCLLGYIAVSELSPGVLSGGVRCLNCCARHLRTANSTPLISISRNLVPFDKLNWKVITRKCLLWTSALFHLWAPARSRIIDPTSQDQGSN